ncbi:Histidyl-tRNA synthetase [Hordeum vulgare]|nr:Histidyl-tRNA synthetase [Hordeum vulgare]
MVPVSQRAMLRLVHGLGVLGPMEKMTVKGREALIGILDEPLSDADIKAISRLTKMDVEALKTDAGMDGPDGAGMKAQDLP